MERELVRNMQRRLKALGFDVGAHGEDGVFGNDTLFAVSKALSELEVRRSEDRRNAQTNALPVSYASTSHLLRVIADRLEKKG